MRPLTRWTAGLCGDRDPAQPLLTTLTRDGRVELSGATTANWVAKSANLLVDGYGRPDTVGLLLPLSWQSVALLLAGVTSGAHVVVVRTPAELEGCEAAFVLAGDLSAAEAAFDAGVEEVFAVSQHPMGLPSPSQLPSMVTDFAREVPSYGDLWSGPAPARVLLHLDGAPLTPAALALTPADRVAVAGSLPDVAAVVLGVLTAGAALVLLSDPTPADRLTDLLAAEAVTATAGCTVPGLPDLQN